LEDIHCAVTELRRRGCQRLSVVGLCFGATLAALYAKECGSVDSLVLWEPWVSGEACIRDMQHLSIGALEQELLGYSFPTRLQAEIRALHLGGSFAGPTPPVLLIEHGSHGVSGLRPELEKSGRFFRHEIAGLPRFWESDLGLTFVPRPLLKRIVTWVSRV